MALKTTKLLFMPFVSSHTLADSPLFNAYPAVSTQLDDDDDDEEEPDA